MASCQHSVPVSPGDPPESSSLARRLLFRQVALRLLTQANACVSPFVPLQRILYTNKRESVIRFANLDTEHSLHSQSSFSSHRRETRLPDRLRFPCDTLVHFTSPCRSRPAVNMPCHPDNNRWVKGLSIHPRKKCVFRRCISVFCGFFRIFLV